MKLYAWEIPFKNMVMRIREKELSALKASSLLNALSSASWSFTPFLVRQSLLQYNNASL